MMRPRPFILFFSLIFATHAQAQGNKECLSCGMSRASNQVSGATSTIIAGSAMALVAGGNVMVESVKLVANGTIVVVKNVSNGVNASIQLSGTALNNTSIAVGTQLEVSAHSTGHALLISGQIIAFIPNEIARALTFHAVAP